VVASRLVYRKGADLLVQVVPIICARYPDIRFHIVGDGNKRIDLEQMREVHKLQDRVTLTGSMQQDKIRNELVKGHIFLNTSLTEAFCIAIVEAASCGLLVVTTRVGGIPEVLPEDMVIYSDPNQNDLVAAVEKAIMIIKKNQFLDPDEMHHRVSRTIFLK
jgi:phosphatidylinositol N-acetylglucosaminyltransferase subunit A